MELNENKLKEKISMINDSNWSSENFIETNEHEKYIFKYGNNFIGSIYSKNGIFEYCNDIDEVGIVEDNLSVIINDDKASNFQSELSNILKGIKKNSDSELNIEEVREKILYKFESEKQKDLKDKDNQEIEIKLAPKKSDKKILRKKLGTLTGFYFNELKLELEKFLNNFGIKKCNSYKDISLIYYGLRDSGITKETLYERHSPQCINFFFSVDFIEYLVNVIIDVSFRKKLNEELIRKILFNLFRYKNYFKLSSIDYAKSILYNNPIIDFEISDFISENEFALRELKYNKSHPYLKENINEYLNKIREDVEKLKVSRIHLNNYEGYYFLDSSFSSNISKQSNYFLDFPINCLKCIEKVKNRKLLCGDVKSLSTKEDTDNLYFNTYIINENEYNFFDDKCETYSNNNYKSLFNSHHGVKGFNLYKYDNNGIADICIECYRDCGIKVPFSIPTKTILSIEKKVTQQK